MGALRSGMLCAAVGLVTAVVAVAVVATASDKDVQTMDLGTFSVSLSVKDLKASRAFYEKLGFTVIEGDEADLWLILRHGGAHIGIFQDKFEGNILTFNPNDVRTVQKTLKGRAVDFVTEADESTKGPASAVLKDPDGNMILLDQHNP